MPIEVVTEIISLALASGMGKQQIATVCKSWKSIVLNTGRFWRDITIDYRSATSASLERLKRVLELSGSATLAVSLEWRPRNDYLQHQLLEHLRAVTDAGIHRWQSLHLTGGLIPNDQPNSLSEIFEGNFSSLRSLTVRQIVPPPDQQNVFEPIFCLIAETCPGLHHLSFAPSEIPELLTRSSIYCDLTSISASAADIAKVRPKFDVPNLYIEGSYDRELESLEAFELPHTTRLDQITIAQLSKCGLDQVKALTLWKILGDRNEDSKTIRFPNLQTLDIRVSEYGHLPWLLFSEAPRLSHLKIYDAGVPNPRAVKDFIHRVFHSGKHRVKISPTCLELRIHLTDLLTLRVLKHWPQVQDLTLHCSEEMRWDGVVLEGLCSTPRRGDGGKALCPDLQVLRIVVWHDFSQQLIDAWLKSAREVLNTRKKALYLWKITLTRICYIPFSHSITIFDVE
jgi:hypothetical protein